MPISAQRQFLVKVSGVDGYFATKTGGRTASEVTREFDGGSLEPEILTGPASTEDITVSRPYKPERDAHLVRLFRPLVGRLRHTVTFQPTDADLVAVGKPTVYPGAVLIGVNDPDSDANSGQAARVELTYAIPRVT